MGLFRFRRVSEYDHFSIRPIAWNSAIAVSAEARQMRSRNYDEIAMAFGGANESSGDPERPARAATKS
jgi:hypothetical protein